MLCTDAVVSCTLIIAQAATASRFKVIPSSRLSHHLGQDRGGAKVRRVGEERSEWRAPSLSAVYPVSALSDRHAATTKC